MIQVLKVPYVNQNVILMAICGLKAHLLHGDFLGPKHPLKNLAVHANNCFRNISHLIYVLERSVNSI